MTAFVDVAEYVDYFDLGEDQANAALDVEAACDHIRDYLCQQIDAVANDVVTLQGTGTRALTLPELPVTAVASVTLDGDAITDYTVDDYGILWRDDPGWWPRGDNYIVTYSHGYAPANIPAILKVVAFQLARRAGTSDVRQESIADYSVTYASNGTDSLLSALDRRVVKRVALP